MRRRDFIGAIASGVATSPVVSRAQQGERVKRVGVIDSVGEDDAFAQQTKEAFVSGLQQLGWKEGVDVTFDYRWGDGDSERIRQHALELVRARPDVILAGGSVPLLSLKRATRTIPIVFRNVFDPVGSGFVTSMAHPGGNITGFPQGELSFAGKMLEVLQEIAPLVKRAAVLLSFDQPPNVALWRVTEAMAPSLGVKVTAADVQGGASEIEHALMEVARAPFGGLIVLPAGITLVHRELIAALAARHRLPAVYPYRLFVTDGGLVSYGSDPVEPSRQAARYVDRILKGEKPADLPVQNPTKYELAVNLKAAKALGLTVSPSLLARADEVIE